MPCSVSVSVSIGLLVCLLWTDPTLQFQPARRSTNLVGKVQRPSSNGFASSAPLFSTKRPLSPSHATLNPGDKELLLTSFLLHISYDGARFTGWSSANDDGNNGTAVAPTRRRSRKQRRRSSGFVRSVEGVLRSNIAKIYGNIDPQRIVVEACSRTDKGVHARGMVAQIYCVTPEVVSFLSSAQGSNGTELFVINSDYSDWVGQPSIPGKRCPHPRNATDSTSCFTPVPVPLSKLAFALNRMCFEMCIMAVAPSPCPVNAHGSPFHPTRSAKHKTYQYTLSTGPLHDPIQIHRLWHHQTAFHLDRMQQACSVLEGTHNFAAFQGAPRGPDDRRKRLHQNTTCTLTSIKLDAARDSLWFEKTATYNVIVHITGDRFLYKMVRFLVGALVAVGTGKSSLSDLEQALRDGKRPVSWECAPACGLVLQHVEFDEVVEWQAATS